MDLPQRKVSVSQLDPANGLKIAGIQVPGLITRKADTTAEIKDGESLAIGKAAGLIFSRHGDTVIRVLAIVSMLSTINAYTLSAPRVLYAMSCDGLFSHHGTRVNIGGTPTVTLLISTMVAVVFVVSGTFNQVLAVIAFSMLMLRIRACA